MCSHRIQVLLVLAYALWSGNCPMAAQDFIENSPKRPTASVICRYSRKDIDGVLAKKFTSNDEFHLYRVRRSGSGQKIYCVGSKIGGVGTVLVVQGATNWLLSSPGAVAYANERDEFVAWFDDIKQGLHLNAGKILRLPLYTTFNVDATGQYFVYADTPSATWLGTLQSPENRICVATNFEGEDVFFRNGEIVISGFVPKADGKRLKYVAACAFIEITGGVFRLKRILELPWASGVEDADPYSEQLLVCSKSDLFPVLYLFDPKSGKKSRVGRPATYNFFLAEDILRTARACHAL